MNLQQQMKVIRHQGIAAEGEWILLSSKRLPMSCAWKSHRPLRPHRKEGFREFSTIHSHVSISIIPVRDRISDEQ